MSGYVGVSLGSQAGHGLSEYRGVWLTAMVGTGMLALIGTVIHIALARGRSWRAIAAPQPLE